MGRVGSDRDAGVGRRHPGITAALAALLLSAAVPGYAGTEAPAPGSPPAPESGPHVEFIPFKDDTFIAARKSGSPVVLYFEADWCAPCKEMHERTFVAPAVIAAAAGIRFFRVDMTKPDGYLELVQKSFRVLGEPTVIVFGPDGNERSRRFGFVRPEDFAKMLADSRTPRPAGT